MGHIGYTPQMKKFKPQGLKATDTDNDNEAKELKTLEHSLLS